MTGAYVDQRWMQHQDPQADFAFLTLGPQNAGGRRARSRASWAATSWSLTRPFRGRPSWSGTAGGGGQPVICLNQASARAGYPAFRCGGFVGGTSGGPWLADYDAQTGHGELYGVTGGGHQGGCVNWVSYSSSFNADTMAVYQRAAAGQQPDVVPDPQPAPC